MISHTSKLFFLASLILSAATMLLCAETPVRASSSAALVATDDGANTANAVLLAEGWGIGSWFTGTNGRTRVVRFCVVTMCIALFIMMRKLY